MKNRSHERPKRSFTRKNGPASVVLLTRVRKTLLKLNNVPSSAAMGAHARRSVRKRRWISQATAHFCVFGSFLGAYEDKRYLTRFVCLVSYACQPILTRGNRVWMSEVQPCRKRMYEGLCKGEARVGGGFSPAREVGVFVGLKYNVCTQTLELDVCCARDRLACHVEGGAVICEGPCVSLCDELRNTQHVEGGGLCVGP